MFGAGGDDTILRKSVPMYLASSGFIRENCARGRRWPVWGKSARRVLFVLFWLHLPRVAYTRRTRTLSLAMLLPPLIQSIQGREP